MRATLVTLPTVVSSPSITPDHMMCMRPLVLGGFTGYGAIFIDGSSYYFGMSVDGESWTVALMPVSVSDFACDGTTIVTAGSGDLNYCTSVDGINWTSRAFPSISGGANNPFVPAYNGTRFLVVSQIGGGAWQSTDGTSWTTFTHAFGGHCYAALTKGAAFVISRAEDEQSLYSTDGTSLALHTGSDAKGTILRDGDGFYAPYSNTKSDDGLAWAASPRPALSLGFNSTNVVAPTTASPYSELILAANTPSGNRTEVWALGVDTASQLAEFTTTITMFNRDGPIVWRGGDLFISPYSTPSGFTTPVLLTDIIESEWESSTSIETSASSYYPATSCWTGSRWLIGGYADDPGGFVSSYINGVWSTTYLAPGVAYGTTALCAGGGVVVALLDHDDGVVAFTSHDGGQTWIERGVVFASGYCESVVWNGALFLAVNWNENSCALSPDGINWTYHTISTYAQWGQATVAPDGAFIILPRQDSSDKYLRTVDGSLFELHYYSATGGPLGDMVVGSAASNGRVTVVVPSSGWTNARRTENGIDWTEHTVPAGSWNAVAWNGRYFCAVDGYNAPATDRCIISLDGKTWIEGPFLPTTASWYTIAGGNGRFLAANYNNTSAAFSPEEINQGFWTGFTNCGVVA